MNNVFLSGRLTADPEVRYTQSQKAVATYTLAVDRRAARNADGHTEADFIRCIAWEKRAEFAERYMRKGRKYVVTGRIQTGSHKDKDGKTVYTTDVVVESQEFADSKPDGTAATAEDTNDFVVPEGLDEELPFN